MAGIMLHGGAVGEAGEVVADGPADALLLDPEDGSLGDEVRVGVIELKESLEDMAGPLVDLLEVGMVVEIFLEEIPQILDFDPHRQTEGDQPATGGAGIG